MLIAWRRFRPSGIQLALGGYSLVLASLIGREILALLLNRGSDFTNTRFNLIFITAAFISFIGTAVIVLATRRLIAGAEMATSNAYTTGDSE